MSLFSVAMIALTGVVNSLFLLHSPADLFLTGYGRVLVAKLILFTLTLALGAVNLLHLAPALANSASSAPADPDRAAARLQLTTTAELVGTAGIIVAVAILGMLPLPHP